MIPKLAAAAVRAVFFLLPARSRIDSLSTDRASGLRLHVTLDMGFDGVHRQAETTGDLRRTMTIHEKKIAEYIREQLQSDIMEDQISLKEFVDPFTGKKNK